MQKAIIFALLTVKNFLNKIVYSEWKYYKQFFLKLEAKSIALANYLIVSFESCFYVSYLFS